MRQPVESLEDKTFERVWRIVEHIGVLECHFNNLQAKYRTMASGWLLATFSAIGFVIVNHIENGFELLIVAGIAAAGCIGIVLLWVVDLLVYHRLLDSCFIEGLILEELYPWLPPFRNNMMKTQKGEGVLFRIVGFYLGPIVLLILVAGASLSLWLLGTHRWAAALTFLITVVIEIFVGREIRSRTENTVAIEERLSETRDGK